MAGGGGDRGGERPRLQTRTPRDEAMEHMLAATVDLLYRRGPDQVTIRDVAEASGHHHRFVQTWFGGKVELFRAAFDRMAVEVATGIPDRIGVQDGIQPATQSLALLMNWLVAVAPGSLAPDLARLMALRLTATTVAAVLFRGPLGLADDDVARLADIELELAELLARSRAGD